MSGRVFADTLVESKPLKMGAAVLLNLAPMMQYSSVAGQTAFAFGWYVFHFKVVNGTPIVETVKR